MSIAKNASRFDFLPDDAGDPFQTTTKKSKKKNNNGSGDGKQKTAKKNANSDKKQLQSLAFGSATEGKKKAGKATNSQQQNGGLNGETGNSAKPNIPPTDLPSSKEKNGNIGERPKGISQEQWEQWQKRDNDLADEAYVSDLQSALLMSKLEFDVEQKNKPPAKGKKKKPVAVPLNQFNAMLSEPGPSPNQHSTMNGNLLGNNTPFPQYNLLMQQPPPPSETDEDLVERFRMEAKLEIERERQKALQRQLLMSRPTPPPVQRPPGAGPPHLSSTSIGATSPVDEKDLVISRLTDENLHLKGEVELLKDRVKAINNYLQAAQEVKDKAKLIYELETVTKANKDLNEELRQVHSQLEQEKSRCSAAMLELRRVLENRRRTATEGSNP